MRKKKIFNFHWLVEKIVPPSLIVLLLSSIAGSFMVERERAIGWERVDIFRDMADEEVAGLKLEKCKKVKPK